MAATDAVLAAKSANFNNTFTHKRADTKKKVCGQALPYALVEAAQKQALDLSTLFFALSSRNKRCRMGSSFEY